VVGREEYTLCATLGNRFGIDGEKERKRGIDSLYIGREVSVEREIYLSREANY
jgi:hypothetical protein